MRGQFNLNFTSSTTHTQPQQRVQTIRILANSSTNNSTPPPEVFRFYRRRFWSFTMVKVGFIGIIFAVLLVIILGILGESLSNAQKPKPKVIVVKRRKVVTSTTTEVPTLKPIELEETLPQLRIALESNLTTVNSVTGSSTLNEVETPTERQADSSSISNAERTDVVRNQNNTGLTIRPGGGRSEGECPVTCEQENCPSIDSAGCPIGLVLDRCKCCRACAVGEGARCFNSTDPFSVIGMEEGICGPGLLCVQRIDLEPDEPVEALCECRNSQSVCGSDNVTYSSECKLRQASHYKRNLTLASWSPCVSAPWVTTPMENVTGSIGNDVSLSCEFRSFPASVIHWEFSSDGTREHAVLPGDDSSIIQTNRGGPEEMMTTSWIQIVSITPRRQGTYYCIAKNTEGMSQSYAFLSVYSDTKTKLVNN